MKIFTDIDSITADAQDTILVIGNFDGVHRGHQSLLAQAAIMAAELGKKVGALTFEPHPRCLFRPDDPPFRITPAPIKARRLKAMGVDALFSLSFNWDFASQQPEEFIESVLKQAIKPYHIIVGYDFCFGQLRKGTPDTIRDAGLAITVVEKIADEGDDAISSSAIRAALRHAEIDKANHLLGWYWEMAGEVIKGDQRGRELGYPTANVALGDTIHPSYGVYATLVNIEGEEDWYQAATNIGIRPMFEVPVGQIEAHILDFDRDIYGKTLRIRPVKKLRGEAKFDSLEALVKQIDADCETTREILADIRLS